SALHSSIRNTVGRCPGSLTTAQRMTPRSALRLVVSRSKAQMRKGALGMRSLGKRGEGGEGALGWPHGDPGHGSIEAFPAVEHGRPKDAVGRLINALFANVAR